MKKISGVYQIQSKLKPDRIYVGSAINIGKRKSRHFYTLKKGTHRNHKLQRHYNKYGKDDLQFSILTECDKEALIDVEQFFIDALNPWFNIKPKAKSFLGVKWSKESNEKKSISIKKFYTTEEGKKIAYERASYIRGKKRPAWVCEKLKKGWEKRRLTPVSEETRHKMSIAMRGNQYWKLRKPMSQEEKDKISESMKGNEYWKRRKH